MLIHCVEAVGRRLKRMLVIAAVLGACVLGDSVRADQITYEMVPVGNPGNASDPATGSQYGAVGYTYQIGKYDVTIGQYTEFLNAVAGTDTYALYNPKMGTDGNIRGIQQNNSSGSFTYSVIGSADRPITYVSWFDAARFANWMTNGQGGAGSTETGAYTLNGAVSGDAVAANPGAAFRLPLENEWYKAAYYSPALNGGDGGYFTYATQSNTAPGNVIGSTPNQANYYHDSGYSVTQAAAYDSSQNYLTDVGAFSDSVSYDGTFDQSGNVYQWNDLDGSPGSSRGQRGGDWNATDPFIVSSSGRGSNLPSDESYGIVGIRLVSGPAAVPEIDPAGMGSVLALVTGALGLIERRRLKAQRP